MYTTGIQVVQWRRNTRGVLEQNRGTGVVQVYMGSVIQVTWVQESKEGYRSTGTVHVYIGT